MIFFFLEFLDFSYVIMLIFNFLYFLNICIFVINSILHPVGEGHKFINLFPVLWVTLIKQSLIDWFSSVSLKIKLKKISTIKNWEKLLVAKKFMSHTIVKKYFNFWKENFFATINIGLKFSEITNIAMFL